jgi:hypothetical protein
LVLTDAKKPNLSRIPTAHSWCPAHPHLGGAIVPNFILKTLVGQYIEAARTVFKRGERLDDRTRRRMRGVLMGLMTGMGMNSLEIASMTGGCARQCRNVLRASGHPESHVALQSMALAAVARKGDWVRRVRNGLIAMMADLGAHPDDIALVRHHR